MTGRRVGLLGGAFNPPHDGHLKLARLALEHLELDELRFVPTARSPHKPEPGGPDAFARLRLLEALLAGSGDPFRIETLELARGGTSYTVDTLEDLAAREPGTAWILVMGSDQLAGFPGWRRAARIAELASVAAAPRPGVPAELPAGTGLRPAPRWSGGPGECVWLPPTDLDLASTRLRRQLAAGAGDPAGLPPQVLAAIRHEHLYR